MSQKSCWKMVGSKYKMTSIKLLGTQAAFYLKALSLLLWADKKGIEKKEKRTTFTITAETMAYSDTQP